MIAKLVESQPRLTQNSNFVCRMKEDKDAFMNSLLKQRKATFETKLKDFNKLIEDQRVIRLADRKKQRKEDK